MSEHLYLLSISMPFITLLIIFGMKYFSAAYQSRSRVTSENAYRELAEKSATAQSESSASLTVIRTDLSDIKTRLTSVENILKEVG